MKIHPKIITASKTLDAGMLARYDNFIVTTAGTLVTLPSIHRSMATHEFRISNKTSGVIAIGGLSDFAEGVSCIAIAPYKSVSIRCLPITGAHQWTVTGDYMVATEIPWSPTLVFNGAGDPTNINSVYRAFLVDGTIIFQGRIWGTDADGKNLVSLTPPLPLPDVDAFIPIFSTVTFNDVGTCANMLGYVDQSDNTAANRIIKFRNATAMTNAKNYEILLTGVCEFHGWTSFTPSISWDSSGADGTPSGRMKILGDKIVLAVMNIAGSDGGGAGAGTVWNRPTAPADLNCYYPAAAIELVNATYSDPVAYFDAGYGENQGVAFKSFTPMTDNVAHALQVFTAYELTGGASFTASRTFTTGTPATGSQVNTSRIVATDGLAVLGMLYESTDGNGATAVVTNTPPISGKYKANLKSALTGYEIVDTAVSYNGPYLDTTQAVFSDRDIKNTKMAAATDAVAYKYFVGGIYPVG